MSADASILPWSVFVHGGATGAALKILTITSLKCVLTQEHLDAICAKYFVPEEVHPKLPSPDATMHEKPAGKIGMYTRFFDYANYRIPFSIFFLSILTNFRILFSQLSVFGSAKFVVPANARFSWFSGSNIVKDRAPAPSEYNVEHVNTLIAQASLFLRFLEEFLCWVGISRNYLLNKDTYPRFEFENGEEMDLNAFIRTADPRKVRIVERARAENERPIITGAKHRTVTLLPTSVVRPSGELSASVEREFVGGASVSGGGDEGLLLLVVWIMTPAASHLPKRLRADYGITGGSATGASPLEEGGDHTDSVTGPSLRTVGPSVRFVVLSDSSHHSGAKSADPEVDSLVRSAVPVMTKATIVTTTATTVAIPADVGKDKSVPHPSIFGSSSSSEKTDHTLSLFIGRSGSGFAAGSIRGEEVTDAGLEEIYVPEWTVTKGFELNDGHSCANMIDHFTPPTFIKTVRGMEHEQLFVEFNVSAAHNLSLSSKVRMHAEYRILEKRKWRSLAEKKDSLLGAKNKEIKELRSQLLKAKEESVEVAQLRARVSSLETTKGSLRGEVASAKEHNGLLEQECGSLKLKVRSLQSIIAEKDRELFDLGASSSSLWSQNQSLVHELETSSTDLRENLEMYEGSMKRCCMRFQESFHPHLLNVVAGRRWLLTHEMKLLMAKCLNSTEYMQALRNAFGRAIEKGMQEGLAARIEHGQAGRCLTDLEAYIPSAEDDFNSAVCDLRGLNFLLLQELSNKKDASTWDVMDLLRLDDAMAEALGMTDLQPDMNQLMVPVHHNGRVEKMERNLVERLPFLKDVFVSLDHPLSAEALIEPSVEVPATNVLSTVVIVPYSGPSVSVEDYENPDLVDVVPKNVTSGPEGEENIDASTGGDLAFSKLDYEARDAVL
ncbi:hypothetical protein Tco_0939339 [Tanacetum coccineum]|uniref:Transposase (Putative), gypsy type n=1 Tax=Tanacetum coccineum TaxID=301880 RepID=A0ABQ5DRM9_9ASTR